MHWEGHDSAYWQAVWHAGEVLFFDEVTSSNDILAQRASVGVPDFSIVVAERQTRGRGRGGSSWQAPVGQALLFSVLFRVAKSHNAAPGCAPLRVGMAVAQAIDGARVKWPNDVVYPGHGKMAGVLCEGVFGSHVVAGIGINVSQETFPAELHGRAASVFSATGKRIERAELLTRVLTHLHAVRDHVAEPLTPEELTQFAGLDILRGHSVVCDVDGGSAVRGTARGVAADGALLVENGGTATPVYNGTVRLAETNAYPGSLGTT